MSYTKPDFEEAGINWMDDVEDPSSISQESYEYIIGEARKRLRELGDTSKAITTNSIRFLFFYITGIASLSAFCMKRMFLMDGDKGAPIILLIAIAAIAIIVVSKLLRFVKSRDYIEGGSDPAEIFAQQTFAEGWDDLKAVYYAEILRSQTKIDLMRRLNNSRLASYNSVVFLTGIILAILPILILTLL
jgi:hypothetical protein